MTVQKSNQKRPVSGWLLLNKPQGMGSTQAVAKIKRLYQAKKAGHAGTLDPLAYGVLPIALGEATKTIPYVMGQRKAYHFTITWGQERSTHDLEGEIVQTSSLLPSQEEIEKTIKNYVGRLLQKPPQFSAIKVQGKRAYNLARQGQEVVLAARPIEIYSFILLKMQEGGAKTQFAVECSKGTYIRSLARDIGRVLGCFGYISALERTCVWPFTNQDTVTFAQLEDLSKQAAAFAPCDGFFSKEAKTPSHQESTATPCQTQNKIQDFSGLDALLIPLEKALDILPEGLLLESEKHKLEHGQSLRWVPKDPNFKIAPSVTQTEAFLTENGTLRAIGTITAAGFKPRRVFFL